MGKTGQQPIGRGRHRPGDAAGRRPRARQEPLAAQAGDVEGPPRGRQPVEDQKAADAPGGSTDHVELIIHLNQGGQRIGECLGPRAQVDAVPQRREPAEDVDQTGSAAERAHSWARQRAPIQHLELRRQGGVGQLREATAPAARAELGEEERHAWEPAVQIEPERPDDRVAMVVEHETGPGGIARAAHGQRGQPVADRPGRREQVFAGSRSFAAVAAGPPSAERVGIQLLDEAQRRADVPDLALQRPLAESSHPLAHELQPRAGE